MVWRSHSANLALVAGLCITALFACPVRADIPRTLAFSGVLEDASGKPKADGTYTLALRLYDAATAGNLLWTEPSQNVIVSGGKGLFSTVLGSPTSFGSLAFDKPYWLEVQVQGEAAPMSPRLALSAAPYALSPSGSASLSLPFSGSAAMASPDAAFRITNSGTGAAIEADVTAPQGGTGILVRNPHGYPIWGYGTADVGIIGTSDTWVGVWGHSNSSTGVHGESKTGLGLRGESLTDGFGNGTHGIEGIAHVALRAGVYGHNPQINGYGVLGEENGFNGIGVYGTASNSESSKAVYGTSTTGYGVFGSGPTGVHGESPNGAFGELGTVGTSDFGTLPVGVYGSAPTNTGYGVFGIGGSDFSRAAGWFQGFVKVNGTLDASTLEVHGSKSFRIDDPLDPANKTLTHDCAEGPEPLDLYNGNVTLDESGQATVQLPDYFEALNKDFRYQLTAIGAPGPNLYVAEEIHNNRFRIAGGQPGAKVSWLVTGVRNDAYMKAHPPVAEEMKPESERGRYLDPASYGLPPEKGIGYIAMQKPR